MKLLTLSFANAQFLFCMQPTKTCPIMDRYVSLPQPYHLREAWQRAISLCSLSTTVERYPFSCCVPCLLGDSPGGVTLLADISVYNSGINKESSCRPDDSESFYPRWICRWKPWSRKSEALWVPMCDAWENGWTSKEEWTMKKIMKNVLCFHCFQLTLQCVWSICPPVR